MSYVHKVVTAAIFALAGATVEWALVLFKMGKRSSSCDEVLDERRPFTLTIALCFCGSG